VLGLYGGKDQGIPLATVERMQSELDRTAPGSTIHVYPEAPHAFHADYRPSYRKQDAEDGFARLRAWFESKGL
jgi:carboxymethylenebutenolidase